MITDFKSFIYCPLIRLFSIASLIISQYWKNIQLDETSTNIIFINCKSTMNNNSAEKCIKSNLNCIHTKNHFHFIGQIVYGTLFIT